MANLVRERYNGNFAYFNVNTHVNPTNVCVYTCDFCAFPGGYRRGPRLRDGPRPDHRAGAASRRARPLPRCTWSAVCTTSCHSSTTSTWCGTDQGDRRYEVHIKAYTAVEIEWFCKITKQSVEAVLRRS